MKNNITDVGVFYFKQLKNGNPEIILEGSEQLFARNPDIFKMNRKAVAFHIVEGDEIPTQINDLMEGIPIDQQQQKKSYSQRLRGVLWHLFNHTDSHDDFDEYYQYKMNQLIEHFGKQIEELKT